ncbi:MAG: YihY/virulence factor BrkB family protein [Planctomycetota bacterium]
MHQTNQRAEEIIASSQGHSYSFDEGVFSYLINVTRLAWRQLCEHRAEGMAAELAYRTIFSMIPAVVIGLLLFRVVGGLENIEQQVEDQLFSFFGVPSIPADYGMQIEETPETIGAEDAQATGGLGSEDDQKSREEVVREAKEESAKQVRASIRETLSDVIDKVGSVNAKSIGVVGLVLLVYAAVTLANSAEQIFNKLYEAPEGRPIHLRLAIHWSIITLGTAMLALSLYSSAQVVEWFVRIGASSKSELVLVHLLSIAASFVLLFSAYAFMPNTKVTFRAATVGAAASAILWEFAKFGFQVYVAKAVPYSNLYGSLGLIPLFMFWIYITWVIILFGLILTYTIQTLRGRRPDQWDHESMAGMMGNPDWMVPVMVAAGDAFQKGECIDDASLSERLGLPGGIVHSIARRLCDSGLLRSVQSTDGVSEQYTPAKPLANISLNEILSAHPHPKSNHEAWQMLDQLNERRSGAIEEVTLEGLLSERAGGDEQA